MRKELQLTPEGRLQNSTEVIGASDFVSPTGKFTSGMRNQMASVQSQQAVTPFGNGPGTGDISRVVNPLGAQLAEHASVIKMPVDAIVKGVFFDFLDYVGNGKRVSADPVIVYQEMATGEYSFIEVPQTRSYQEPFTWEYEFTKTLKNIIIHRNDEHPVAAGTVLAYPASVNQETGFYANSTEANYVNMSIYGTIEDGLLVSEEYLEKVRPLASAERSVSFGKTTYPRNTYGTLTEFRCSPKPNEPIRKDKLIFATFSYDQDDQLDLMLGAYNFLPEVLCYGAETDSTVYASQETRDATVVSIHVETTTNEGNKNTNTPETMVEFIRHYADKHTANATAIVDWSRKVRQQPGGAKFSGKLEKLIVRALGDRPNCVHSTYLNDGQKGVIRKAVKRDEIPEWVITVKYTWLFHMGKGAKMSNRSGMKGVVCETKPRAKMPTNDLGIPADIAGFGKGAVARITVGDEVARYISACAATATREVKAAYDAGNIELAHSINRTFHELFTEESLDSYNACDKDKNLQMVLTKGIYPVMRADNAVVGPESLERLAARFPPHFSTVKWDNYGEECESVNKIMIGTSDIIWLDKSYFYPFSTSFGRMQHHGLLAPNNKETKVSGPVEDKGPRAYGEAENRSMTNFVQPEMIMNIVAPALNPEIARDALGILWKHASVSGFPMLVNREKFPYGSERTIAFARNVAQVGGTEIGVFDGF